MIVAIDGPAGAGKSTLASMLAERRGLQLVETGALYRSVALLAAEQGVSLDDEVGLAGIADSIDIRFAFSKGRNRAFLNGRDVTTALRSAEVSDGASRVSALPRVREALLELQRELGRSTDSVLEGRDIGTVVFPDADAKFFVTASAAARASRRLAQLRENSSGELPSLESIREAIEERDRRDSERKTAPLKAAEDALVVDTSDLTLEEAFLVLTSSLDEE